MKPNILIITLILILLCVFIYGEARGIKLLKEQLGQNIQIGKQYLLLIGIDDYEHWVPLSHPVKDAREIRDIITDKYYIDEVVELYDEDATQANILRTFTHLKDTLQPEDSLLVFYAGHGHLDENTGAGFFIPVDAGEDQFEMDNWIPNVFIRGLINNMKANHVCLLVDACFSGDILKTPRSRQIEISDIYIRNNYSKTARFAITSGAGNETVPDESEFALYIKKFLKRDTSKYLDPYEIYRDIRKNITQTSLMYGYLHGTEHEDGGIFILFLRPTEENGYITMSVETEGILYINGVEYGQIKPGGVEITECEPGEYNLTMEYADGYTEEMDVTVHANDTVVAAFIRQLKDGLIAITAKTEGTLYIDEDKYGNIQPGNVERIEHKPGEYTLTIKYTKKNEEQVIVKVESGITTAIDFMWINPNEGVVTKPKRMQKNYLSTGVGFGYFIPLGEAADFFEPGYFPMTFLSYNLRFDRGILGIGIVSGTEIDMSTDTDTGYDLYAIPVAALLRYTTDYSAPFYGFIEATGGGALNLMDSNNPDETNTYNIKPCAGASLGLGYYFAPGFSISLYSNYTAIFFTDVIHMGMTTGVRCELNF